MSNNASEENHSMWMGNVKDQFGGHISLHLGSGKYVEREVKVRAGLPLICLLGGNQNMTPQSAKDE